VVPLEAAEPEDRAVRIMPPVGLTLPLHCTAAGKVHLAFDPEEQLRSTLPEHQKRFTDRTIVDRIQLVDQLQAVARDGYAVDTGEFVEEVNSVAVPIRDYTRLVVGSLAIAGPAYRLAPERISTELIPALLEAGGDVSRRLGFNE
jgi:DNA-binding IclR family transcriptional regulator